MHQEFEQWLKEVKESAISDFGYSEVEASNFSANNWKQYYDANLTPSESILEHLKKIFNQQNK